MVQALRLNTMSKLTFADSSRFDALVKDVFSGISFTDVEDQILTHALEQVYKEARLEIIPSQVCAFRHLFTTSSKNSLPFRQAVIGMLQYKIINSYKNLLE